MNKNREQNPHVRTAVLNKMTCAMTCAVSLQLQNFRRVYVQDPLFTFRQCEDYSEQSTSSLRLLPGKDVYFNVSILTLFVFILNEYLYCVWLRFHYNFNNKLNSTKRIFH